MSLSIGSITVNVDATYSGSGMAKAIMDSEVAGFESLFAGIVWGALGSPLTLAVKRAQIEALAAKSRELASKLVPYLKDHVVVRITVDGDEYTGTIE